MDLVIFKVTGLLIMFVLYSLIFLITHFMVITTAQFHSTEPQVWRRLKFCSRLLEVGDDGNLWQCSRLRNCPPDAFLGKGVLKLFRKFTGEYLFIRAPLEECFCKLQLRLQTFSKSFHKIMYCCKTF